MLLRNSKRMRVDIYILYLEKFLNYHESGVVAYIERTITRDHSRQDQNNVGKNSELYSFLFVS